MLEKFAVAADALNLIHWQDQLIKNSGQISAVIFNNARVLMIMGLVTTLLTGLILALRIIRSVRYPLAEEVDAVQPIFSRPPAAAIHLGIKLAAALCSVVKHRISMLLKALLITTLLTSWQARAEPGSAEREILIGQSAAMSGPAKALGLEMRAGVLLYLDQVNAAGGIHGRRILLISADDASEPTRAVSNTRKLINDDKVLALIAYVGTSTSLAALPILAETKTPLIGVFSGAQSLRDPFNRYIFNVRASSSEETEKIVEQLTTTLNKRIAVFYQNDAASKAEVAGVESALKKRGLTIAATGLVEPNSADVSAAVKSISISAPDAVIMISSYTSASAFVKAMKRAGSTTHFHNYASVGGKALMAELGDDGVGVAVAQVVPSPWSGTLGITRDYQQVKKADGNYSFTEFEGYLAARVLVEGLKSARKDLTREKLISGLEKLSKTDIGGFSIDFSPTKHNGSNFVDLSIIGRNGKFMR
jgi:ABC-type branched-subunit amino acid transport system substrate-binding protein